MFRIAQKMKQQVASLLLFSFMNVLTFFVPGSQLYSLFENREPGTCVAASPFEEEITRSTVLELLLEKVAGLEDRLPESEKPDFSYDYFNIKFRCIGSFLLDMIAAPTQEEDSKTPLIAEAPHFFPIQQEELPHLQHHNFVFRLTPF